MRKVSQRAGWLAALGVVVGITAASPGEAATGPMKLPFPDPPMVGDPDGPDNCLRVDRRVTVTFEFNGMGLPIVRVVLVPKSATSPGRRTQDPRVWMARR
jgi:hypothetical protein